MHPFDTTGRNSGTFVQFRKFGDLALATEANSDSPKMYGETEEPSASMVVPDDIFQVSTQDLAGYLSFRPKLLLQDPSGIMAAGACPEFLANQGIGVQQISCHGCLSGSGSVSTSGSI